jgi:hypothetical protein
MDVEATERAIQILELRMPGALHSTVAIAILGGAAYHLRVGLKAYLTRGEG